MNEWDKLFECSEALKVARIAFAKKYARRLRQAFDLIEFVEQEGFPRSAFSNWELEMWSDECLVFLLYGDRCYESFNRPEHRIKACDLLQNWGAWSFDIIAQQIMIEDTQAAQKKELIQDAESSDRKEYMRLKIKFEGNA